jgi:HAMP domain-containing protein
MPIETPQPPQDALEAVRQSVARREPRRRRGRRGGAPPTSVSAPQRVYTVGLEALANSKTIEASARATGWRFLVEEATEPVAAAEVQDQTRAAVPAELTEGPFVCSTADGLRAAETLAPVQESAFELRLLRVPALHLVALWLHATDRDDLFMPLEPAPPPFEARHSYPEPEFGELATSLARQTLELQREAERPDELGG